MKNPFSGLIIPLVTPFSEGEIDYCSLKNLISFCATNGANGFVCLGTTAETPTLTPKERDAVVSFCIENSRGLPVISGAGSNCTADAVKLAKRAYALGANGVLSVCPYYNIPPVSGMIAHFCEISNAVPLPVILYDVPSRTGVEMSVDAIYKLSGLHNITGIKAAGNSVDKLKLISEFTADDFALFCGNDILTAEAYASGAAGTISAAANVIPEVFAGITSLFQSGKGNEAKALLEKNRKLIRALYTETNPVAIKYALSAAGMIKNELRLPMCPISRKNAVIVDEALKIKEVV